MNKDMYRAGAKVGIEPTFFGKVMSFFALAMIISAVGAYIGSTYWISYFIELPWLMWALFITELALIFTSRIWSDKIPINRILFTAFAFITGVTIAPLVYTLTATAEGTMLLYKALGITGLTFAGTALIGSTTQKDLSGMRIFLLTGLIGLILVQVVGFFIPWGNTTEIIVASGGIVLFSAFTAYDFQMIKQYPEDRYIDAALNLYLDIFNMFIYVLRLLMALNNRN